MLQIDDYAYSSTLTREIPKNKLFFGILPLIICLVSDSISVSILTILLMAVLSMKYSKISCYKYLKLMFIPFGFLLIGTATIIISKNPLEQELLLGLTLGGNQYGIMAESLLYGIRLILRALSCVGCMYFISLNTPMSDLLYALQKLHVPKLLISLMELIYNYIFVLLDEAHTMKIAQSSRLGYHNFKTSIKSTGELIAMLFLRTYLRCDNVYSALESRGYTGELKMLEKSYEDHKGFVIWTVLIGLVLTAVAVLERSFIG